MKTLSKTLWSDDTPPTFPSLSENTRTDICIVGGGIVGLLCAYNLLKNGRKVLLVDSHQIISGETAKTSAHLSNALDDRYHNLISMHGLDKATLAAQSHAAAIDLIEQIMQEENIDCDFKRVDGYLFAPKDSTTDMLDKEFAAAKSCGLAVRFENVLHLGKVLVFPNQAQFHPVKFLKALVPKIVALGGLIYEQSQVIKIDKDTLKLTLKNNCEITAQKIITATDSHFFSPLSMNFKINPQRSYVIGIEVPVGKFAHQLMWDCEDPYHYVRVQNKDAQHDILIIGGEDHRVGVMAKGDPYANLLKWTETQFGKIDGKVVYQWSGQIEEPIDYLGYIGCNPKNKNIFMVTGDSGNGLTHAAIASMLITDLILDKQNVWESLYRLNRMPFKAIGSLLLNAMASSIGYLRYFAVNLGRKIKKGEGRLQQQGLKKIAVYVDDTGVKHECSGICSHLGAVLAWNNIEKTWDCPAHGSRFDVDGKVLNAPAMQNLSCPFKK